ncbi:MAG: DASH family cryptochrome [Microscillaceae bacterium]|nr:DASH family cryptochrome [Microscillaceae bacterium]MDW8460049.1 DASH family cryptochrome [Cytophagales bacterium]
MKSPVILVWFRNDLRLHDQEPLYKALQKKAIVIPVYCFDIRQFKPTFLGFPKTNYLRANFLIESVKDLRKNLQKLGSNLVVRVGIPEVEVSQLARELQVNSVYCSQEVTQEEIEVEQKLEYNLAKHNITLKTFWTSTLFHIEDLPFPICKIPDVFTQFRKECERICPVRPTFATPTKLPALPQNIEIGEIPTLKKLGLNPPTSIHYLPKNTDHLMIWKGGESEALAHLNEYLWEKKLLHTYKETRNGLLGKKYSSKLSAWLALGCISVRYVYEQVQEYEKQIKKNESTYWLIFELIWRDYFRFIAKKYKNAIFKPHGIKPNKELKLQENTQIFQKWINGQTGIPFIDANMRELQATGFMSNRGRQNVASFLVKDLHINWIWGAMYFESQLIDYDVCSNWGNWTYVAGVGNDPRENRYFNILKQAKQYDPKGEYVKFWLPELAKLPANLVHTPYALNLQEQKQYDVILGADYPTPIVQPEKWEKDYVPSK